MLKSLKKLNGKRLNAAAWITLLLAYLLPFQPVDAFTVRAGWPLSFVSIHRTALGFSPFDSMGIAVGPLLGNIALLYVLLSVLHRLESVYSAWLARRRAGKAGSSAGELEL